MSEYTLRNSDGDEVGTIELAVPCDAEIADLIDLLEDAVSASTRAPGCRP